jgi:hypothetical protein
MSAGAVGLKLKKSQRTKPLMIPIADFVGFEKSADVTETCSLTSPLHPTRRRTTKAATSLVILVNTHMRRSIVDRAQRNHASNLSIAMLRTIIHLERRIRLKCESRISIVLVFDR